MTETPKIEPGLYGVMVRKVGNDSVDIIADDGDWTWMNRKYLRPLPPALSEADEAVLKAADVWRGALGRNPMHVDEVAAAEGALVHALSVRHGAINRHRTPSPAPDVAKGWVPEVGDRARVNKPGGFYHNHVGTVCGHFLHLVQVETGVGTGEYSPSELDLVCRAAPIAPPAADVAKLEREVVRTTMILRKITATPDFEDILSAHGPGTSEFRRDYDTAQAASDAAADALLAATTPPEPVDAVELLAEATYALAQILSCARVQYEAAERAEGRSGKESEAPDSLFASTREKIAQFRAALAALRGARG